MKHYGDITKISGYDLPVVDVITGGSPCQDLSVAGKRAGLKHAELGDDEVTRSGLFMDQLRIVKEMRARDRLENGRSGYLCRPRFMVWENVGGAFSSGTPKGADFQAVLQEIVRIVCEKAPAVSIPKDGWPKSGCISGVGDSGCTFSVAWRLHDAQFWGVPQRRKRIALVADFGGLAAPEILFERKGLFGDTEQGGAQGEGTAERAERSPEAAGKCLNSFDVQSKHIQPEDGIAESLYSGECRYGGGESYCLQGNVIDRDVKQGGAGVCADVSYTLDSVDRHGVFSAGFKGGQSADARSLGYEEEKSPALTSEPSALEPTAVVIPINTMVGTRTTDEKRTTFGVGDDGDPQFTLSAAHEHAVFTDMYNGSVTGETAVTLNANTGASANHAGPSVLSFTNRGVANKESVSDTLRAECHGAQPCILDDGC